MKWLLPFLLVVPLAIEEPRYHGQEMHEWGWVLVPHDDGTEWWNWALDECWKVPVL